jgi:hypothetical protein
MEKDDTPADAFELASESLFPAPPIDPANVKLKLKANTTIGVHGQSRSHISDMGTLGGLGDFDGDVTKQPHPLIAKPEWIPEDEKKGRWKREVKFDTTLLFACTPTIQTQTLTCQVSAPTWSSLDITSDGIILWVVRARHRHPTPWARE